MSQTCDEKRFTISEVAADFHELMITLRIAAIRRPHLRTTGPSVQPADIPSPSIGPSSRSPSATTHFPSRWGQEAELIRLAACYAPRWSAEMWPAAVAATAAHRRSPVREVETWVCRIRADTCASRGRDVAAVPSSRRPPRLCRSRRRAAAVTQRSADWRRRSQVTLWSVPCRATAAGQITNTEDLRRRSLPASTVASPACSNMRSVVSGVLRLKSWGSCNFPTDSCTWRLRVLEISTVALKSP